MARDGELQRLIAAQEIGNQILHAGVVARSGGVAAAEIDHRRRKAELFGVPKDIAVGPGHPAAAAQVARIRGVDRDRMAQAFPQFERNGNAARFVGLGADLHADLSEHIHSQKIAARGFDGRRLVGIAAVKQQSPAHQRRVHPLQSFDVDIADLDLEAGCHVKAQIEHRRIGCFVGNRRIDLREGVALFLQRRKQTSAPCQHAGGNRGLSAAKPQGFARVDRRGHLPVDVDAAQVVKRAQRKADRHLRAAALGQRRQRIAEAGIGQRQSVDRDGDVRFVVPEALQRRFEPIRIAARPRDQAEGTDRRRFAQGQQIGRRFEGLVDVVVSHRGEINLVGLRIGRPGAASPPQRAHEQECEDSRFHSSC